MPAWLIKLLVQLVPPDKAVKIALGSILGAFAFVGLLFSGPIIVYKHIPLGKTASEFDYYIEAAEEIEEETDILINWQYIMAIDAVVLEQDFSRSSKRHALRYQDYFIRKERKAYSCPGPPDENGNPTTKTCYRTVYYERDFDDVLEMLVDDGIIRRDQIEDVKRYTLYDISELARSTENRLPSHWRPVINEFAWPVPNVYTVTSLFGSRIDPITFEVSYHNGVDIGAPDGTPVLAAKEGKVISAGYLGTAGNAVIIKHDQDMETRYYHLSKILVKAGEKVKQNQKIGEVGSTGRSTGPHLHFEIRVGGTPIDPLRYFE